MILPFFLTIRRILWEWGGILAVAAVAWMLQATWVWMDQGPPDSDDWHHLTKAEILYRSWKYTGFSGLVAAIDRSNTLYPPLVHLTAIPFFAIAGSFNIDAALHAIGPYLFLLVLATGGCIRAAWGKEVGGPTAALAGAAMMAGMPLIVCLSRKFLLDLPSAAMLALAFWAMLASDGLRRPFPSTLAGVATGLAMMAKFTAGIYVVGGWALLALVSLGGLLWQRPGRGLLALALLGVGLWVLHGALPPGIRDVRLLEVWQSTLPGGRWVFGLALGMCLTVGATWRWADPASQRVLGLCLATGAGVAVAGPWYINHAVDVIVGIFSASTAGGIREGDPNAGSLSGWLLYLYGLTRMLPRGWLWLILVGSVVSLLHPRVRRSLPLLAVCLGAGWLVLSLSENKEFRYTVALHLYLVILGCGWLAVVPALLRGLVTATIVAGSLLMTGGWVAMEAGWKPPMAIVWPEDHILSSGRALPSGFQVPKVLHGRDLLTSPDFYAISMPPRNCPFEEEDLPLGRQGP